MKEIDRPYNILDNISVLVQYHFKTFSSHQNAKLEMHILEESKLQFVKLTFIFHFHYFINSGVCH